MTNAKRTPFTWMGKEISEEKAHLIAASPDLLEAAPDLLEALKDLLAYVEGGYGDHESSEGKTARAAIAKAEGRE